MDKKLARTFFLFLVLFISPIAGCADRTPYPVNAPTLSQPATASPMAISTLQRPTPSVAPSQTSTKISPTSTKIPLATDTPSPEPSQTLNVPGDKGASGQTLSGLMLSREDYQTFEGSNLGYLDSEIFETFFQEGAATITDASAELNSTCLLECTKQVWATESENVIGFGGNRVTINRKVVIVMLRSMDETTAQKTALNFYNAFAPYEFEYGDLYKNVTAPDENTRIGWDITNNRRALVLTTSVGSIVICVINFPHALADDGVTEVDIATYFANLQIMKLKNAGVIP